MYIGLHVKYPLLLSDFSKTWIASKDFWKIVLRQISWKFIQWGPSCSTRSDRQIRRRWIRIFCERVPQILAAEVLYLVVPFPQFTLPHTSNNSSKHQAVSLTARLQQNQTDKNRYLQYARLPLYCHNNIDGHYALYFRVLSLTARVRRQ
jgi:hypothetical protein